MNRSTAGQADHRFQQRLGRARRCAIDEEHTTAGRLRNDVGFAGNRDDEQIVAESNGACRVRRRLRRVRSEAEGGRTQHDACRAADGGLHDLPACVTSVSRH
jgi:hypothetical protein